MRDTYSYRKLKEITYDRLLKSIDYNIGVKWEEYNYSPIEKVTLILHHLCTLLEMNEDWIHPVYQYIKDKVQDEELHIMLDTRLNEQPLKSLRYFWC